MNKGFINYHTIKQLSCSAINLDDVVTHVKQMRVNWVRQKYNTIETM